MTVAAELVERAVAQAQQLVSEDADAAVLMIDGPVRRTFITAGEPGAVWEAECAMDAAGARRAVFVMPVDEGEQEFLHIVAVDLDWGFDIHRVLFARNEDQTSFRPIETLRAPVRLTQDSPGYVLIQAMRAFREGDEGAS